MLIHEKLNKIISYVFEEKELYLKLWKHLRSYYFFAAPLVYGSSWARD